MKSSLPRCFFWPCAFALFVLASINSSLLRFSGRIALAGALIGITICIVWEQSWAWGRGTHLADILPLTHRSAEMVLDGENPYSIRDNPDFILVERTAISLAPDHLHAGRETANSSAKLLTYPAGYLVPLLYRLWPGGQRRSMGDVGYVLWPSASPMAGSTILPASSPPAPLACRQFARLVNTCSRRENRYGMDVAFTGRCLCDEAKTSRLGCRILRRRGFHEAAGLVTGTVSIHLAMACEPTPEAARAPKAQSVARLTALSFVCFY